MSQVCHGRPAGQEDNSARAVKHRELDLGGGIKMELVYVGPGKFMMGSPGEEKERWDSERQHDVEITKGFWMGVYPVTQEQYEKVMGKNPSSFSASGDDKPLVAGLDTRRFPVENVSWQDGGHLKRPLWGGRSWTKAG
jgi:formylglycine-generating enzyme required for sulfatase activity